jgi:hypothetical protein
MLNGIDQPIAGLYKIFKPKFGHPYWELLYHNPNRTIYLTGNVKIINTEIKEKNK